MKNKIKRKGKERKGLFLGLVEKKVYCKYVGEHSPWQGDPKRVQSAQDQTDLGHVERGRGREIGDRRQRNQVQQPGGQRYRKEGVGKQNACIK